MLRIFRKSFARFVGGHRSRRRNQTGAAAVEFALILVPLTLVVFGVIQYSIFFWSTQSAADAARETARRSAVGDLTCPELTTQAQSGVVMRNGAVTVARRYYSDPALTTAAATPAVGNNVKISVSYKTVNMFGGIIPLPNNGTVTESAYARLETETSKVGVCP
jgi:Flp pilus assembly protein TadG